MNPLSAATYVCLSVALYVAEPSQISLTTQDRVRIDRLADTGIERHGGLLSAGTNTVNLTPGTYVFRTAHDARIDLDGNPAVRVVVMAASGKDEPPPAVNPKGDSTPDRVPTLTIHQ